MSSPASVSVVVVNYNRREMLRDCLKSLLFQTRPPLEIIVVDNGSADLSADLVEKEFGDRVRVIRLPKNLGFAGGNNVGLRAASGDWVALINNDAVADPGWLAGMLEAAAADPKAGLVACRVLRAEKRDLLDNIGVRLWPDGMSRGAHHFQRAGAIAGARELIPSGAAMLGRRDALLEAGGFDESFFCYSEDTDLGLKVRLLGFSCVVA